MTSDTTIVPLRQPDAIDDPLTVVLRSGARRLLAQAVEAEAGAFLALMKGMQLPDGRERLVRHGLGPERVIQTGIGPVEVRRVKLRARGAGDEGMLRVAAPIVGISRHESALCHLLLNAPQQPLSFVQAQTEIADLAEIAGSIDLHHIDASAPSCGTRLYQTHDPAHALFPLAENPAGSSTILAIPQLLHGPLSTPPIGEVTLAVAERSD